MTNKARILAIKEKRSLWGDDGTAVYFLNYLRELKLRGIIVFAMISEGDEKIIQDIKDLQIPYCEMPTVNISFKHPLNTLLRILSIRNNINRYVKKYSLNILEFHFAGLCHLKPFFCNIPVVINQSGALSKEQILKQEMLLSKENYLVRLRRKIRFQLDIADLMIVQGEDAKATTILQFDYKKDNFLVSPFGTTREQLYSEYCNQEGPFKIIACGRFSVDKGMHDLVEIAKKLHSEYPGKFLIEHLGHVDKNDEEINTAYQNGKDFINFRGIVSDPVTYMNSAWALLNCSHREAAGLVNFEAKSASIPIFSWDVVGNREYITHDVNGYLFKQGSIDEMVKRLNVVSDNILLYHKLRKNSFKDYEVNFKFTKHIDRYEMAINKLL